jgi:hypothetical protein
MSRKTADSLIAEFVKERALEDLKRRYFSGNEGGRAATMDATPSPRSGSVQELMADDPLAFDYMVDITRTPIDPNNPDLGWNKKVYRTRMEKDKKKGHK